MPNTQRRAARKKAARKKAARKKAARKKAEADGRGLWMPGPEEIAELEDLGLQAIEVSDDGETIRMLFAGETFGSWISSADPG
jgi:hypothetical protein